MPQLDFSWWMINLVINWTLWATVFLALTTWVNTTSLKKASENPNT